ncbi:hypothetical protein FACS189437_10500 [Bacteroidia bacterium]|nr:hypothetical protein FACS189437_10500 [Bacteroidia bacterium]
MKKKKDYKDSETSGEYYYQLLPSDLEFKKTIGSRMKRVRKKIKRWFFKLFSSHRISNIDLGSKSYWE